MLKKWHETVATTYLAQEEPEQAYDQDIPFWREECGAPVMGDQLTSEQRNEMESLLKEYPAVFQELSGKTQLAAHRIVTGDAPANPITTLQATSCLPGNCAEGTGKDERAWDNPVLYK